MKSMRPNARRHRYTFNEFRRWFSGRRKRARIAKRKQQRLSQRANRPK
jgi:hypothetical protein